jgi:hypothetical protein
VDLKFLVNGKVACHIKPLYGKDEGGVDIGGQQWETVTSHQSCLEPTKISIGDKLRITSDYDLRQHRL